jgi:hypothetical protein
MVIKSAEVQLFARKMFRCKLGKVMVRAGSNRGRNGSPHTGGMREDHNTVMVLLTQEG